MDCFLEKRAQKCEPCVTAFTDALNRTVANIKAAGGIKAYRQKTA